MSARDDDCMPKWLRRLSRKPWPYGQLAVESAKINIEVSWPWMLHHLLFEMGYCWEKDHPRLYSDLVNEMVVALASH